MGYKPWSEIRDARPDTPERRAGYEAARQEAHDEIATYKAEHPDEDSDED